MNTKTFLIPLAAAAVLAATALPAAAAPQWSPIAERQAELDRRIDTGLRRHSLTPAEAVSLRKELRRIERLEHRYRRDGLSRWEMADLDRRMDALSRMIRWEKRDADRAYGYGYGDHRHGDGQYHHGRR